jgi:SET domain-containing protein
MEAAAKMIDEGKGVRERILDSQRLLKDRLTFGKSNIHGWGLIAKQPIKAGTMVIPLEVKN